MCRALMIPLLLLVLAPVALAQDLQIGVLGLFHPQRLTLRASGNTAVVVRAADKTFVLEAGVRTDEVEASVSDGRLLVRAGRQILQVSEMSASARDGGPVHFMLSVPEKLRRSYFGRLVVKIEDDQVVPIVSMDLETAVASAVQAESAPGASMEALKAQAVVIRSYYVAGKGRHHNFDFCDLTHCQFLREPPSPQSPAAKAALATRGLVIVFAEKPVAAMYTRSCGGQTRTPAELGIPPGEYPYFAVVCEYCYKNPARWDRHISVEDAELLIGKGEAGRLAVDRRLGWNAVPSNTYTARKENGEVVLEGAGQGHGIGLCQRGARSMAESGANFREILNHYFPNTSVARAASPFQGATSAR